MSCEHYALHLSWLSLTVRRTDRVDEQEGLCNQGLLYTVPVRDAVNRSAQASASATDAVNVHLCQKHGTDNYTYDVCIMHLWQEYAFAANMVSLCQ